MADRTEVRVPSFRGRQALQAWLDGHDMGLLCQGPDPDSAGPLLHGRVVAQDPPPGTVVERWSPVTVWVEPPGGPAGVREPRRTPPPRTSGSGRRPFPGGSGLTTP